jgi:hypothetical protein
MELTEAVLLTSLLIIIVLALAWYSHREGQRGGTFCPGPYNIGLYDSPHFYPTYEGRDSVEWDGDRRCATYCQQEPCVVWCR